MRYFVDSWGADLLAGVDSSGQALAVAPVVGQLDRVLMVTHERDLTDRVDRIITLADGKVVERDGRTVVLAGGPS